MTEIDTALGAETTLNNVSMVIDSIYHYLSVKRNLSGYNISVTGLICLILLYKHPTSSVSYLGKLSCQSTAESGIKQLIDLDMVRKIGKPRLIIPFQRYKVDKGYVLTAKGEQLLRKILVR